ncbi:MAG: hypothetical protein ABSA70_07040, partial [Terriglobia bacterium]
SLEVRRDGKLLFAADAPLEIRHVRFQEGRVSAEVRAAKAAKLRVGGAPAHEVGPGLTRI